MPRSSDHAAVRAATFAAAVASIFLSLPSIVWAQAACVTPLLADEPPCSPAVADSPWPISHHGPYAQGSTSFPGPVDAQSVVAEHVDLPGPPITLAMSPEYADGHRAVWASVLGLSNAVVKLDTDTFDLIDSYVPANEETSPPTIPLGVSGAYAVVNDDFHFVLGRANFVEIFRDSMAGDRSSPIELAKRVFLPPSAFCRPSDLLVGGVMLPDGMLAFVTEQASVGVIPSDLVGMDAANVISLPSENGADCADAGIADEDLETVSNSMAADEFGAFYVVTDKAVIKYQWDGSTLSKVWRTEYASDAPFSVLRLGPGSGSTPSLMGTELADDRFVVITDGQELMHLVLMWRDEIPADWTPIAPGKDPRIACEIAVTFGDPAATRTLSEQSVLVRGYSAVVVNNLLADETDVQHPVPALAAALAALEGGNPAVAPFGIERFDWDPETRTCQSVWSNDQISLPNAIPTMSAATGLMYAIGQRDGVWGLEAVDFATGASAFTVPSAQTACSQSVIDAVAGSVLGGVLSPVIDRLPASCENSLFAATEVGPDGVIYTGTFQGASRFVPSVVATASSRRQAIAGVGQGIDLVDRGVTALSAQAALARDAAQRGQTQLDLTIAAIAAAESDGELDATSQTEASSYASAARAHFAAAEAAIDMDLVLAGDELGLALEDLASAFDWLVPCPPTPQADCRTETKSRLVFRPGLDSKSKLVWKWKDASAIDPALLPDPRRSAVYALCLYEPAGRGRLSELAVSADRLLWSSRKGGDGFQYGDKAGSSAGTQKVLLSEKPGKAIALFKGRGTALPGLDLPIGGPLVVQLVSSESALCWQASYDGAGLKKNEPGRLTAVATGAAPGAAP